MAVTVTFPFTVTDVDALFALAMVPVPVIVQLLNVQPAAAAAVMLTCVPAGMFAVAPVAEAVPPAVGALLTVSVNTCRKLAVIVALPVNVTVVDALFTLAIAAPAPVIVQLTNWWPAAAVAEMFMGVLAA